MLRRFLYRLSLLILAAWVLALLPSPSENVPLHVKNLVVGMLTVIAFGKLLYDTLFFDRYQP